MTETPTEPEFSHRVPRDEVGPEGRTYTLTADADARRRLAQRFDLLELPALVAELRLDPVGGGAFALTGQFRAEVVQRCVVTEAPVAATLEGTVERRFAPASDLAPPPKEEEVTADEVEPPEPIIDDVIEIGEPVAEELALALDPFPRAPGATFEGFATGPEPDAAAAPEESGPFAKLAELRKGREE